MNQCTYMRRISAWWGDTWKEQCVKDAIPNSQYCNRHLPENRKVKARCDRCGWENTYGRTAFENHWKPCRIPKCGGRMKKILPPERESTQPEKEG